MAPVTKKRTRSSTRSSSSSPSTDSSSTTPSSRIQKRTKPSPTTTKKPAIDIFVLRAKLITACKASVPAAILHEAQTQLAENPGVKWISNAGEYKRYYILHLKDWHLHQVGTDWEAEAVTKSKGVDAGNGVRVYVEERVEWRAFVKGFRQGSGSMRGSGGSRGWAKGFLHGGRQR
ncbi:hypothetical protein BDV95DRAFT_591008 [Massariosphaeria phaeospora]|uniref:Uncharacterized protein n=1 Tax=Massariosphaeria phaeospora TaxID=100035 RepID=A0A7C8MAL1_9PLEO|nr:hypothetical protein BDV95DRAFT_591008 [Massariosphaeria phaeospora]